MGIHFEYAAEHNLMFVIFYGPVTDDEFDAHINRLLSGEYNTPGTRGLIVMCENISGRQISWGTIFDAGKRMIDAKFRKSGRLAIVAGNSLAYGLARIYQIATELDEIDETRVMRKEQMNEALQWLEIDSLLPHITDRIRQCEAAPLPPATNNGQP